MKVASRCEVAERGVKEVRNVTELLCVAVREVVEKVSCLSKGEGERGFFVDLPSARGDYPERVGKVLVGLEMTKLNECPMNCQEEEVTSERLSSGCFDALGFDVSDA
eukprot:GHVN01103014.1.p1 GENE.GHVN01103014.1~~GHVN01103014.1.p1  ORF type:complete len:107 (-),score=31.29 GHVN01103014.1:184-504(-)